MVIMIITVNTSINDYSHGNSNNHANSNTNSKAYRPTPPLCCSSTARILHYTMLYYTILYYSMI